MSGVLKLAKISSINPRELIKSPAGALLPLEDFINKTIEDNHIALEAINHKFRIGSTAPCEDNQLKHDDELNAVIAGNKC